MIKSNNEVIGSTVDSASLLQETKKMAQLSTINLF
jgi:hypothetical protein